MAIVLEATSAGSPPTRTPIEAGRNSFRARPGTRYQVIDDTGAKIDQNVAIRRVGNDLLVDGLPDGKLIELDGFFTRCTPDNSCALSMQNLGGTGPAAEVSPATEPVAALKDGSFLMYTTQSVAGILPAAPEAAEAGSWFKPVGYTLAALAVAGAAGGGGGGGGGGSAPVDTTPPAAPVVSSGSTTKSARPVISGTTEANATVTVFIDIDGAGTFPVRYQVKADGAGNWTVDTATTAPVSGTMHDLANGPAVQVRVVATDAANNQGPISTFSLTVDNIAPAVPTIAAVATDNIVTGAEKAAGVTLQGTAEAGSTVSVTWGSITHLATAAADGSWASVFTAAEVPADSPSTTVSVVATDAAGNASSPATRSVVVDSLSTVIISPIATDGIVNAAERAAGVVVTGTAKPNSTVSITWSGSAGAAHTTTADGSGNWTTTFATADIPALASATITATATDPLGNVGNNSRTVTTDLVAPTAPVITDNVAAATATGPVTFTLTFSEPVTGLTGADISVVGGTAGALTQVGTSNVYTLAVTPTPGTQAGTITVSLPAGTFTDAAGNPNAGAASASQNYDTAAPTLTITDGSAAAVTNAPTTFTFAFNEAPTGFAVGDIQVTGGTAGTLTAVDATHYTLVVTPNAATAAGTMTVTVAAASFSDALGNVNGAPIVATQDYDTLAPSSAPTITDNVPGATATGATTFTFAFAEAPLQSSLALGDFTVSGGTASALTQIDATHYSILVTPAANSTGTMSVSLGAGTFTDAAGNANTTGSLTATQAFDTNVPTVTITDGTGASVTNSATTFNFALSEAPAAGTFTAGDVNVTGGSAGALTQIDATHYSMVVTPTVATASGTMSVSIAAGAFTNASGTGNTAAGPATQDYDTLAPSTAPTITDNVPGATATGATTFTFAFAEAPLQSSLALGDFTVSGGTASALTQIDATHYSILVTPAANSTGTMSVSLGAGTFTDAAGNANTTGSLTATQAFDTNVPTVTITDGTGASVTNSATTFNFALSEAPAAGTFTAGDVNVTGGSAGALTQIDATHYSMVVTPTAATASGTMSVSIAAGAFTNASGTGNTAAGPATQAYDTLAPTETTSAFTITDNVAPTTGVVANNGTTDDSSPTILLTLSSVLAAGETLTLFKATDAGGPVSIGTATAGSGTLNLVDAVTVGSAHTYTYSATIVDAAGNSSTLDLNGAGAGNNFLLNTL